MARMISADHVIMRAVDPKFNDLWNNTDQSTGALVDYINREETADCRENIHATWVADMDGRHRCSNCQHKANYNEEIQNEELTPFCAFCGAMVGM